MTGKRAEWVGGPPSVRERFLAAMMVVILLLSSANNSIFDYRFFGLAAEQLHAACVTLALPFGAYWMPRVRRV